ncbi:MAG: hypothetical protein ACRD8A_12700 [Candidatus Acidiferrales bacterium]
MSPEKLPPGATAENEQDEQDYGPNNEKLPEELQTLLKDLARKFCDEDKFSRRLEIQTSKKAHWFWRSLQHIYWDSRAEGWVANGPNGAPLIADNSGRLPYNKDSAVLYTTNIHQPYGLTLIAVLTQDVPAVVAVPEDPDDAADLATAKAGTRIRKIVEHKNDAVMLVAQACFFAYVDGRTHAWTRNENGETKISVYGSLNVKVPITAPDQKKMLYVQYSDENHVAFAKAENPEFKDKIRGGAQGSGQDVYERTARVSVMQGTSYMSGSGDTLVNLATEQQTWMLPAAFELENQDAKVDDPRVAQLKELFPDGCRVKIVSGVYVGSWNESHLDHWDVFNAMPGDGQFRNSLGFTTESVNERFNDIINIAQDVYEKTIPASHWDVEMFGTDGQIEQTSMPGARYPVKKRPTEAVGDNVFFEPPASVSPDMLQYGQQLMGPVPQFLTGAFPALFGGGEAKGAAGDTASGYAMQRDQAMGRIGLVFRAMKRWWANIMGKAVKCAAELNQDLSLAIPDAHGNTQTTKVRLEELKGNVHWHPETDDGLPESPTQQRQVATQMLALAEQNPVVAQALMEPENLEWVQRAMGTGLKIPGADSAAKQMAEINELKEGAPSPNPQFEALQQKHAEAVAMSQQGMQVPDQLMQELMEGANTPQNVSSVPVDPDWDDHKAEYETVFRYINGMAGQKLKAEDPVAFENIKAHGMEHKFYMAKQAASMPQPPPMPANHRAPPTVAA